ncbi:cytochrome P450 [Amycolatopsis eburnea]|uniref:Cytochrome P450 n=1 Tax=Amycolatopsis eburnea TaxID=2267691 RepID=A0A3R9EQ98_9PSEU|nr:cytochrome P450 [Amycolatopsis eburnea]RSD14786.1 cytochrome P450 [Amycolatopsis eburnea]
MAAPAVAKPVVAPGRVPGLGHLPRLVRDPFGFFVSLADVGDVVTVLIGRKPVHLITTPRLVRSVLLAGGDVFRRGRVFEKATKTFGGGVIVAEGDAHRRQRRLMQPAFGRHRIASYVPEMREAVVRGIAKWHPGEVLDVPRVTHEMAVDALVHTLFKAELADGAAERIMAAFPGIVSGIMAHTLYPADWLERVPIGVNRRYQKSSDEVRQVVDDVIARSAGTDSDGASLLDVLIKAHDEGAGFDRDLLRDEVVTLLIAGSETVATTLAWTLHEIAGHPAVERLLVHELTTELGDTPVRHSDFARLPVLDRVIKETLRLHTPNWLLTRRATEPTTLGGYRVPAGAEVGFSLTALHRDPKVFDVPLAFDPDRWLDENLAGYAVDAMMPFGVGRHRCPGDTFAWAELGVAIATILRKWRLVHQPGAKVRELPLVTVQPSGLRLVARRRAA